MTQRTGGCACGAVTYVISAEVTQTGACHCETCRKWSGGVYMGVTAPADGITFSGTPVQVWASSAWAERGFCGTCGSGIYYRVTAPGPHEGEYHVGFGGLDDQSGIALTDELFTDCRAPGFSFAQDTKQMTRAEVFALFGG